MKQKTIALLLVEDSEHDILAFRRSLRNAEIAYEVEHVNRSEDGLQLLKKNPEQFQLIVADHKLPGMSGLDFCREVRAQQCAIPLVLMTGGGTEELAVTALKSGVDDYIVKDSARGYLRLLPLVLQQVLRKEDDRQARRKAEEDRENLILELKSALEKVKTLSGLLPICSGCKKIRNDEGYWQLVEVYLKDRSNLEFTHGLCPQCMIHYYPEYAERMEQKQRMELKEREEWEQILREREHKDSDCL